MSIRSMLLLVSYTRKRQVAPSFRNWLQFTTFPSRPKGEALVWSARITTCPLPSTPYYFHQCSLNIHKSKTLVYPEEMLVIDATMTNPIPTITHQRREVTYGQLNRVIHREIQLSGMIFVRRDNQPSFQMSPHLCGVCILSEASNHTLGWSQGHRVMDCKASARGRMQDKKWWLGAFALFLFAFFSRHMKDRYLKSF